MQTTPSQSSFVSDELVDRLIREDVPYIDLTTWLLEIGPKRGRLELFSREKAVVAGTEEACRVFSKLGADTRSFVPSGTAVVPGQSLLAAEGRADALHAGWKVSLNILEHASGIATRTQKLVELAHQSNPRCAVVATRKGFPGTRELSIKAVLAGGGLPHRLGLSESVLVFRQHRNFLKAPGELPSRIAELRTRAPEKKLFVEVDSQEEARTSPRGSRWHTVR